MFLLPPRWALFGAYIGVFQTPEFSWFDFITGCLPIAPVDPVAACALAPPLAVGHQSLPAATAAAMRTSATFSAT